MESLHVLYLTDDNYAAFAGISITSLFANNTDIDNIVVYVIDDNISNKNKQKMLDVAMEYRRSVVFLDLSDGISKLESIGVPKYRNSYTTYLKLFTFDLLPTDVHRIVFIDSDSIVVGSLRELISINLNGKMIAAVRDGLSHSYKLSLGYDYNDSWFNMGVMVVDVDNWKKNYAQKKIERQLELRKGYIAVDQDLLNITQHGNIMTLHPKYNATPHHYVFNEKMFKSAFKQGGFYEEGLLEEAQKDPVIRHFERFMGESAWNCDSVHPYSELFYCNMKKSNWSDYKRTKSNLSGALKIENTLYKILPKAIFIYIHSIGFRWYLHRLNNKLKSDEELTNIS